jgi:hypothetical protein
LALPLTSHDVGQITNQFVLISLSGYYLSHCISLVLTIFVKSERVNIDKAFRRVPGIQGSLFISFATLNEICYLVGQRWGGIGGGKGDICPWPYAQKGLSNVDF